MTTEKFFYSLKLSLFRGELFSSVKPNVRALIPIISVTLLKKSKTVEKRLFV